MKIIYLYGPPAVGKLTTAKELSKITGYKIYHNHLAHDLVSSVVDYRDNKDIFFPLIKKINLCFLSNIPKNINGIIITNCYEEESDKQYLDELTKILTEKGSNIYFVRLLCDNSILNERVENEDRKNTTKLKNKEKLSKILLVRNYFRNIKYVNTLVINNNNSPAYNTANRIKDHYSL